MCVQLQKQLLCVLTWKVIKMPLKKTLLIQPLGEPQPMLQGNSEQEQVKRKEIMNQNCTVFTAT